MMLAALRNVILLFAFVLGQPCDATSVYDGYELIAVTARSPEHIEFLGKLEIEYGDIDFWNHPMLNESTHILVPPHLLVNIKRMLDSQGIEWTVGSTDITSLIDASRGNSLFSILGQSSSDSFHSQYHSYDEITSYLKLLQTKYPDNMEIFNLTHRTPKDRTVIYVKLMEKGLSNDEKKESIIIEAGIHAREWISSAVNIYVIEKLLEGYRAGTQLEKDMIVKYDWYIVPVVNPDGYEYSRKNSKTRLWRKNRRRISQSCVGVDLNRNFNIHHGGGGTSINCRSLTYSGPLAFSEPETTNLKDLFFSLRSSLKAFLSIHSYGQFLVLPWAYSKTHETPPNIDELERVAKRMVNAIKLSSRRVYHYGSSTTMTGCTATDWAIYEKPGIYSMTLELRPTLSSIFGFLLPPKEILPTAKEYYASLKALAGEMKS